MLLILTEIFILKIEYREKKGEIIVGIGHVRLDLRKFELGLR